VLWGGREEILLSIREGCVCALELMDGQDTKPPQLIDVGYVLKMLVAAVIRKCGWPCAGRWRRKGSWKVGRWVDGRLVGMGRAAKKMQQNGRERESKEGLGEETDGRRAAETRHRARDAVVVFAIIISTETPYEMHTWHTTSLLSAVQQQVRFKIGVLV